MSLKRNLITDLDIVRRNIRFWREERRMTVRQLAELVNISHSGIVDIESGRRTISITHLLSIAEALQVDIGQFFVPPPVLHAGQLPQRESR